jgi:hypothetical protein
MEILSSLSTSMAKNNFLTTSGGISSGGDLLLRYLGGPPGLDINFYFFVSIIVSYNYLVSIVSFYTVYSLDYS